MKRPENILRETKIVLLIYDNQNKLSDYDIAEHFNISTSTVRRSVCNLRELGIIIHSRRKYFYAVLTHKQADKLRAIAENIEQLPQKILKILG